jgi:predicted nucleotide-binding protein (sugar kinase/HSP70/actin superfamily)
MYKWFLIIGFSLIVLGWVAYGIYNYIADQKEKKQPKARSQKYNQAQQSMAEYAKKMASFKKKRYDKTQ